MKRIPGTFVFVSLLLPFTFDAFAPVTNSVAIIQSHPVEPFKHLIRAIGYVETGFDTLAYNPLEEATGFFQIRPIRLDDYNLRTGSDYVLKDMYDYRIAEKIFLYYASIIGPYDFERIARNWNGSGEMTTIYWQKVSACL